MNIQPSRAGAPTIDSSRLQREIEAFAAIDRRKDGSCCRLALSDSDRDARDRVVGIMRDAGMSVQIDRIGNIIGIRPGREALPPVMTGSHVDTVATGGRLDGLYGVVAGLEVVRVLNERGLETRRPIAVAVFTNEEGVRFQPDMMGSLAFAGGLALEDALAAKDSEGLALGDELRRIGYAGSAECGEPRPHAFVELHIEQGPVLDRAGEVLGAVESLQGIAWHEVSIRGVSNHAGTTPMHLRHDAGYCAARVATFVRELAGAGDAQVGTVGRIELAPNLVNVIARSATLTVDLRHTDDERLEAAERRLFEFLDGLAKAEGVSIRTRKLARTPPVRFDEGVLRAIEQAGGEHACSSRRMVSGAGHDAQMMARICPAAMIFVPSIDGISHNPREDTRDEHLAIGANVLLSTILRLADGD